MNAPTTLRLDFGASEQPGYDIIVGKDLLRQAGRWVRPVMAGRRAVIITDDQVGPLYLDRLRDGLNAPDFRFDAITVPAGEGTKNFAHLQTLLDNLLDLGVDRTVTLIGLGGGVVGDLSGFAASILLRGVGFVQVPTTLLAQVDSSVGGKTGINTGHGKNLIGSFYQPKLVLADTDTLTTLPRRQFLAGYAETVKYGLIDDPAFFTWLEDKGAALVAGDQELRRDAIAHCCEAKARVVAEDERESGRRALLNLGHTFGHALEAEAGYGDALLHGEAVAIGTGMAFDLSVRMGLCPPNDRQRVMTHFEQTGLPLVVTDNLGAGWTGARLVDHMRHDKKMRDGKLTFILTRGIGKAFTHTGAEQADIIAVLDAALPAA